MQRVSERPERRLLEGLALRGMRMDRSAISSSRAPISSARPNAAESSDTSWPTAWMPSTRWLSARATTRTNPSSPSLVIARPLAVNGNRPTLISGAARRASSGDRPTVTISGSVKQTAGMARLSQLRLFARDDLGDHFALRHRAMRQHRLAGDVADRVDAAHRGAALVVDAEEFSVHVEHEFLASPAVDDRLAPDGDEDLVGGEPNSWWPEVSTSKASAFAVSPFALAPTSVLTPSASSRFATGRVSSASYCGRMRRLGLDDGDLGAHLGEGGAEFQADIAAADDDQPAGDLAERQRLGRGNHRAAKRQRRQCDRRRAGGDHDRFGADDLRAGLRSRPRRSCRRGTWRRLCTILTLLRFNRPATPLVSRPTMPSFQATVFARSISGSADRNARAGFRPPPCAKSSQIHRPHGSAPWKGCSRR